MKKALFALLAIFASLMILSQCKNTLLDSVKKVNEQYVATLSAPVAPGAPTLQASGAPKPGRARILSKLSISRRLCGIPESLKLNLGLRTSRFPRLARHGGRRRKWQVRTRISSQARTVWPE